MEDIQTIIYDYICKANSKLAELSSEANDLLNKTGCNCDITSYVEDINDINSSLYILHKGWENIDLTFGYKNFLISLFPVEDFDPEAATIEFIHAYIDRYSMNNASVMVTPLFPQMLLGSGCCDGFVGDLYYNKTESDNKYYPRYLNPEGYLKEDDLIGLATEQFVNEQGFLTTETDPTVPAHVKAITVPKIAEWDAKVTTETDPTVPVHVKGITTIDIDNWNSKIETETDPTVANYIKSITTFQISEWDEAYQTTLNLTPLFIPANIFTQLGFSRLGGYIVGTEAQPISGNNIPLSIGGDVAFSRAVIFHNHSVKPIFSGTGINVTEIGDYTPNQSNEIVLLYNGDGRVVVIYTGDTASTSIGLVVRGTTSFTSDTALNVSGFTWEIDGSQYSSGVITGIPVTARPLSGIRIDAVWGNSSGLVLYTVGSDSINEVFTGYPDRVLLSLLVRKADSYSHPSYSPIDVNTNSSVGFVISRVITDALGSVTSVSSKAITKADVGLDLVDNTSDLSKPVSTATTAAISALDSRFLRKDANDNNGMFSLILGNLTVNTLVTFSGIATQASPSFSVGVMTDGTIVKHSTVTISDITGLQDQIDAINLEIDLFQGDKNYSHLQALAALTWTITHGLNKRPAINVYDSDGNTVQFAVDFISLNQVVLYFSGPISGTADFN